jgi:hypothetical protein
MFMGLPQLLTSLDVEKRQAEENYGEQQHRYVLHMGLTSPSGELHPGIQRPKRLIQNAAAS